MVLHVRGLDVQAVVGTIVLIVRVHWQLVFHLREGKTVDLPVRETVRETVLEA